MVLLLLFLLQIPVKASESGTEKIVRVGYYQRNGFQSGMTDEEEKSGYGYEYLQQVSYLTGWKYSYVYGTFQELYEQFLDGEIDLLGGIAYSSDRSIQMNFPQESMISESYYVYKHQGDTSVEYDEPQTYKGKTIGVLQGTVIEKNLRSWIVEQKNGLEPVNYETEEAMNEAFSSGEVDLVIDSEGHVSVGSDREAMDKVFETEYYLCAAKDRPDLLKELNAALVELKAGNTTYLDNLRDKYYKNTVVSNKLSKSEQEWVDSHSELRIAYFNNYLPYSASLPRGGVTGIVVDVTEQMIENMGLSEKFTISYQGYDDYADMIVALKEGEVDAMFPCGGDMWYTEQNGICQTNPVVTAGMQLAHLYKGTYQESNVKKLAVNRYNLMQYYYTISNYPHAEILSCDSIEDCLQAVLDKKADGVVINELRASALLKNNQYDTIMASQLAASDNRCYGVAAGNVALLKLLNRGIASLGADYGLNASYQYTGELYHYTVTDFIRDNTMLAVVILVVIMVLMIVGFAAFICSQKKRAKKEEEYKRELKEALEVAQHANKAKTNFLNNMSHDIRTPMNAIIGFTSLAVTHIDNKEQVRDYLGKIMTSSNHLLSLINDMLDMSRIESGQVKIEENECHLPTIMHDLRNILQSDVRSKRLDFFIDTVDVVDEDIICDKLRLNQILLNCMSNAIKFTKPGGTVGIRIFQKECSIPGYAHFEFVVKDNGIGMTPEFAEHIFEPFTREENSTVSGIPGTGLGMSITKHIVDMMGGTIHVKSEKNGGTEVTVSLNFRLGSHPHRVKPIQDLIGLRALVADDSMDTCVSVSRMLESIGMRAEWTMSGVEATYKAKYAYEDGKPYRAFIIDWLMPDMNGVEVVRRIRGEIGDDTPIIILTAYDWSEIEEEAREAGVTAFCAKPIFLSDLYDILNDCVDSPPAVEEADLQVDFKGKRILLVEDNELNMEIAMELVGRTGAEVETAENGETAVRKVQESAEGYYDLIFMDIQMPVMDGYEATRQIRRLDREDIKNLPIIAMTANAFAQDRETAYEAGMNEHTTKPIEISALYNIMKKYLL